MDVQSELTTTTYTDEIERRGFSIVVGVLSRPEVDRLIGRLEALPTDDGDTRARGRAAFARRNLLDLDFIRELAVSPRLTVLVRPVIGDSALPVRGILFDKTPGANWVVPWHQDLSIAVRERLDVTGFGPWSEKAGVVHVQPPADVLRQMLTIRLHIDDCDEANGPLRVVPGTHHDLLTSDAVASAVASREQVTCCCPAGGAVVMRPMILHASSSAQSPAHRRVIHIEYASGELPRGLQWRAA